MPTRRSCSFCGNEIEPGTGKMFIRKDGTVFLFCSHKCQANMLKLGRVPRWTPWTQAFRRAAGRVAAEEAVAVAEEVPARKVRAQPLVNQVGKIRGDVFSFRSLDSNLDGKSLGRRSFLGDRDGLFGDHAAGGSPERGVHGVHRGTRPSFNMFAWHLCEQKRKTVPSFRMNILPVPGSISLPQNEHERRVGIVSPDRELAGLARRLAQHQDVADLDAALHVARDDAALVPTIEDADLDLDRFARHPGAADDLDDLRGNAVIVRHVLSLACPRTRHFFIARIFEATSSMTGFALPASRIAIEAVALPRPTATPSSCLLGT